MCYSAPVDSSPANTSDGSIQVEEKFKVSMINEEKCSQYSLLRRRRRGEAKGKKRKEEEATGRDHASIHAETYLDNK